MMIISALKELPILEKRIRKNIEKIQSYSSYGSHVGPEFESLENQKSELRALLHSNLDLCDRYLKIRKNLNKTNLETEVLIEDKTLSIAEWIIYRNLIGGLLKETYLGLNKSKALNDIKTTGANFTEGVVVSIIKCYDEKEVNKKVEHYQSILNQIDAKLEIINATTDLIEGI